MISAEHISSGVIAFIAVWSFGTAAILLFGQRNGLRSLPTNNFLDLLLVAWSWPITLPLTLLVVSVAFGYRLCSGQIDPYTQPCRATTDCDSTVAATNPTTPTTNRSVVPSTVMAKVTH